MTNRATRREEAFYDLIAAARHIRLVQECQRAHTVEMQKLAAEARRTGENLSHRVRPMAFDYGDPVSALLDALDRWEKNADK